jgi:hypothetical protein
MDRPFVRLLVLALLSLLAAISVAWGAARSFRSSADLMRRAEEAALFRSRLDPYQDPDLSYPPSALPVFALLVPPISSPALKALWLALNLAALGVLCATVLWLWGRSWPGWLQVAFCLAVVASKPVRGGIGLGQFHLIPTCLVLLSVVALRHKREGLGGLLLGLALIKPTMALGMLGFMFARRHYRALATAAALQAVLLLTAAAWLQLSPIRLIAEWLARAQIQEAAGLIDLPSLLHRAWPDAPLRASLITGSLLALTIVLCICWRHRSELTLVSICLFASAIMAYHRPYDLVLLVPALAFLMERACAPARSRLASCGAILFAAALILPNDPLVHMGLEPAYDIALAMLLYGFLARIVFRAARDERGPMAQDHAATCVLGDPVGISSR